MSNTCWMCDGDGFAQSGGGNCPRCGGGGKEPHGLLQNVLVVSGDTDPVRAELDRSNLRAALRLGQLTATAIRQACYGGDGPMPERKGL